MRCLPPELVTAPSEPCVSIADARAHLRVDSIEEDALITAAIAAAVQHLDGYGGILGRALMKQDWRQFLPFWPASRSVDLALAPVLSVVSVEARGADGQTVTVDPASYRLVGGAGAAPRLLFDLGSHLPGLAYAPDAVIVTFSAGYGEAADKLPPALKSAILLMVGDLYRFRDSVQIGASSAVPMSTTVDRLIAPFRRYQI
ncbi:putative phiE125 gp8 family phage protein [Bosea sp. OAE752]|uniref:head-tail connector protein n=1 Tax=Bosea sp. OAE752 TaxID=2663873 RepID=UPI003D1DB03C